ncbi:MAG: glycine cleavage system protein GcvH [Gammaproteobacteria bacterium]
MSQILEDRKYSSSHEWALLEDDGHVLVGISDHAQALLGDLVFVELPAEGAIVHAGDECGVVESVKAASDLYSPISGEVVEVNNDLTNRPDLVNSDPYGAGWIYRIQPNDVTELEDLLDADAYSETIEAEE